MKKSAVAIAAIATCLTLAACGSKPAAKSASSSSAETASSVKPSADAQNRTWTYKNNIYDAGIETYRFTKSEVRPAADEGKKALVLYCDVTNNSDKEQDPSNIYMVVHAFQKNATSDIQLDPGLVKTDENGDDPLQKESDGLNNKLLPGKTVKAAMIFVLQNDNPVRLQFDNPDLQPIGCKTINIK